MEVREAGHAIGNARWEAGNVRDLLDYAAGGVERLTGRQIPVAGGLDITILEPLGVVGVIAPWNFPMPIAAWGTAPALAAGNAVILKPAETTPLTALRLAELALEAGLPEDLFQVLPGHGPVAGNALVEHPGVAKIVFTGSTGVGKQVLAKCAGAPQARHPRTRRQEPQHRLRRLGPRGRRGRRAHVVPRQLRPGLLRPHPHPRPALRLRPLPRPPRPRRRVRPGRRPGGREDPDGPADLQGPTGPRTRRTSPTTWPASGARRPTGPGFWFPPTVLTDVDPHARVAVEEVFGPVAVVLPFDDEADAVALANATDYGLSGSIWTRDVGRALRVSQAVRAGNLSVNSHSSVRYSTPFGGFKQSGIGRELGPDALDRLHRDQERLHQHGRPRTVTQSTEENICRRLVGRTAVITGAGSGIGLATARRLASEGAHVVCGDVDETRGKAAADEVGGIFVKVDVTDPEQVEALFKTAYDTYGSVDIAFNNAGISPPDDDSILDTGLEAWKRVQEVNLTSVYLCCKAAIPYMRRQGKGSIINTASFVARMGAATSQISYTASKGGVLAMSRELGVQFAREGIRVNALCPGPVNTPLLQELFAKDPERAARRLVHIPVGRFAEADEIAAAVAFLASDDSSFVNATDFLVDGGISGAYVTPL